MFLIKVDIIEGWMELHQKTVLFSNFVVNEMAYGLTREKSNKIKYLIGSYSLFIPLKITIVFKI